MKNIAYIDTRMLSLRKWKVLPFDEKLKVPNKPGNPLQVNIARRKCVSLITRILYF